MLNLNFKPVRVARFSCAATIALFAHLIDAPGVLRAQELDCESLPVYWATIQKAHISSLPELRTEGAEGDTDRIRAIVRELVDSLDPRRDLLAQSEVNKLLDPAQMNIWRNTLNFEAEYSQRSMFGRWFSGSGPGCQLVTEVDALKTDVIRAESRRRSLVRTCSPAVDVVASQALESDNRSTERAETVEGLCARVRDRVTQVFLRKKSQGTEAQRALMEAQDEVAGLRSRRLAEPTGIVIARAMAHSLDVHSRFLTESERSQLLAGRRSEIDRLDAHVAWANGIKVGVIRFNVFFEADPAKDRPGVTEVVATKIQEMMRDASLGRTGIEGLVIDLRENMGGAMKEAVETAGLFLDQGVVLYQRMIEPDTGRAVSVAVRDEKPGMYYSGPLIVLTSHKTASAAEIFAGAMRAHRRGPIMGTGTTYGKGVFQEGVRNRDWAARLGVRNSNRLVSFSLLTVGMYFTPNGEVVQGRGIPSDVMIEGEVVRSPAPSALNQYAERVERPELGSEGVVVSTEAELAFNQQMERARQLAERPSAATVAATDGQSEWGREQGFIGAWVSLNQPTQVEASAISRDTALLLGPQESKLIPLNSDTDLAATAQGTE